MQRLFRHFSSMQRGVYPAIPDLSGGVKPPLLRAVLPHLLERPSFPRRRKSNWLQCAPPPYFRELPPRDMLLARQASHLTGFHAVTRPGAAQPGEPMLKSVAVVLGS